MDSISISTEATYKTCSCDESKKFICIECFVQICKYCHKKQHNGCKYKWSKEFSLKKEAIFKQLQINFQIFDEQREKTFNEIQPLLEVIRADIPDSISQTVKDKILYLEKLIAICKRCRDFNIDQDGIKTLLRAKEIQKTSTQELEELEKRSNSEVFDLIQKFVNSGFQLDTQKSITKTIEPSQIHQIKQNVFNFYIDYSVRCVLKTQLSKDIADLKHYINTKKELSSTQEQSTQEIKNNQDADQKTLQIVQQDQQSIQNVIKTLKQSIQEIKSNQDAVQKTLKIVQQDQQNDQKGVETLKQQIIRQNVNAKYWYSSSLDKEQIKKITGFDDYTKMKSVKYNTVQAPYGCYISCVATNITYPITKLCSCGCGAQYYIQENDYYVFAVKYSCGCGGYFVVRIPIQYFV